MSKSTNNSRRDDYNWVDGEPGNLQPTSLTEEVCPPPPRKDRLQQNRAISMVESAFLASTASLIWLIDYYLSLGPFLKILFPLPIALVYLRRGARASLMTVVVCGLLLAVLMGPPRSIIYIIPYGLMGMQLGVLWRNGFPWNVSLLTGSIIGIFGFFFRFWLFSILLGEDLWIYVINQITGLADWIFIRLGILGQPSPFFIEVLALCMVFLNSLIYVFSVHLVALLMLDRLKNPIPRPPNWVKVILDYE